MAAHAARGSGRIVHEWPEPSVVLGSQSYSQAELQAILDTPTHDDASLKLARQRIAAKLNIASGSSVGPATSAIADADAQLNGFADRLPHGVEPKSEAGEAMLIDARTLDDYNHGLLIQGCSEAEEDEDRSGSKP